MTRKDIEAVCYVAQIIKTMAVEAHDGENFDPEKGSVYSKFWSIGKDAETSLVKLTKLLETTPELMLRGAVTEIYDHQQYLKFEKLRKQHVRNGGQPPAKKERKRA